MEIEKKEPKEQIGVRIPSSVRSQAKAFAREHGVKESDVYRSIISDFFSTNRLQKVNDNKDKMKGSTL